MGVSGSLSKGLEGWSERLDREMDIVIDKGDKQRDGREGERVEA